MPESARSLLDVGCSRGGFGRTLRAERQLETLWGIEPDEGSVREAALYYDRVILGSFPSSLPDDARFDCIVFNDVLEHMSDPWSALEATHRILEPGGRVVAAIPNVRFITVLYRLVLRGDFSYTESGILDRTHLRFFTRSTAIKLFESSGFAVESVRPTVWGVGRRLPKMLPQTIRDLFSVQFVIRARVVEEFISKSV